MKLLLVTGKLKQTDLIHSFLCESVKCLHFWDFDCYVDMHQNISSNNVFVEYNSDKHIPIESNKLFYSGITINDFKNDLLTESFMVNFREDTLELIDTDLESINANEQGEIYDKISVKANSGVARHVTLSIFKFLSTWFDLQILDGKQTIDFCDDLIDIQNNDIRYKNAVISGLKQEIQRSKEDLSKWIQQMKRESGHLQ